LKSGKAIRDNLPDREVCGSINRPKNKNFPIGKNTPCGEVCMRISSRSGRMDMIKTAKEFGQMVARARKALGITQRELALAINAGERFIVELEAGKPTAQLGKALAAARAAGVRLEDASGQTDERDP
jgi:ribosome-binding protein aMBF1 (putative translation factor)